MGKRERKAESYILSTLPVLYISGRRDFQGGTQQFLSDDAYGRLCTVTGVLWTGQGYKFDGIGDKITVPVPSLANSDFTIGCLAKRTATGAFHFMCSLGAGGLANYDRIYLRYSDIDGLTYGIRGDSPVYTPKTPISGSLVFWMWSLNTTTLARNLYENGTLVASNTALSAYLDTATSFHIGEQSNDA